MADRPPEWRRVVAALGLVLLLLDGRTTAAICTGDLDGSGGVSISEVVRAVGMALGRVPLEGGTIVDRNGNGAVEVAELIAAVGNALRGCPPSPTATPIPTAAVPTPTATFDGPFSGLIRIDEERVPNAIGGSTPHVADILVGDRIYLANSGCGVTAYDLNGEGLTFLYSSDSQSLEPVRCTSLALHAPSRRLYCGAVDRSVVSVLEADTGRLRSASNMFAELEPGYRDLHVVGDDLYLAAFDAGLLKAPIAANGSLGDMQPVLAGNVVGVDGDAQRLVVLDRDRGLRIVENGLETASIALDAPALRVVVRDHLAIVALGSRGAVVIDLDTRSVVVAARPPCVATEADYDQGALAIACTVGLYLYQTTPTVRTAGWDPAEYSSLGARFAGDFLIANDWWQITAYRVDTEGRALGLDAPRGFLLERGQGIRFAVRNPDDQPQHVDGRELAPHGELFIDVPPAEESEIIRLATDEQRAGGAVRVAIARDTGRVAFDRELPMPYPSRYVSFIQPDCALQFPALEDLAWLNAQGEYPGGLPPLVLLVPFNDALSWPAEGFLDLWGPRIEAVRVVDALAGAPNSNDAFEDRFGAHRFIPGADTTIEMSVDASGRVAGFDRVYRGAYPLPALPW